MSGDHNMNQKQRGLPSTQCPHCERHKLSASMWRNKAYEASGTPLPWNPEELLRKEYERGVIDGMQEQLKRIVEAREERMTDCNHLWRYSGSKRQQAWQCGYCQAWRFSEPVMREGKDFTISKPWVSLTEEEINEVLGGDIRDEPSGMLEFVRAIEAKLKEKNA